MAPQAQVQARPATLRYLRRAPNGVSLEDCAETIKQAILEHGAFVEAPNGLWWLQVPNYIRVPLGPYEAQVGGKGGVMLSRVTNVAITSVNRQESARSALNRMTPDEQRAFLASFIAESQEKAEKAAKD